FGGEQTLPPEVSVRQWLALWSVKDPSGSGGPGNGRLGVLSRGTRQAVGLRGVLDRRSNRDVLLLLDEPWEGLDPDASRWLSDTLIRHRQAGAGAIVSSHRIHDLAGVCDRCLFLVNGRLARDEVIVAA